MRKGKTIYIGEAKIWMMPAGSNFAGANGDSYGRKHPKGVAVEDDWKLGDLFCFEQRNNPVCFLEDYVERPTKSENQISSIFIFSKYFDTTVKNNLCYHGI